MREETIRCDGCGERLPGNDGARYSCVLECQEGPNAPKAFDADLCGYCASLVRVIMLAQDSGGKARPISVELARR